MQGSKVTQNDDEKYSFTKGICVEDLTPFNMVR